MNFYKMGGNCSCQERRSFLQKSWNWIRLTGYALLVYPILKFLHFHVPEKPRYVKIGKLLAEGETYFDPDFALFAGSEKDVWAVSRKCTHLGCRLHYSEKEHLLICPCHQSRFTPRGKRIAGPARKDLKMFQVEMMTENGREGYVVTL